MTAHERTEWAAAVVAYETGNRAPLVATLTALVTEWESPTETSLDDMVAVRPDVLRLFALGAPRPRCLVTAHRMLRAHPPSGHPRKLTEAWWQRAALECGR